MSFSIGSLIAWSKDGAWRVGVSGQIGSRSFLTSWRKDSASNVNAAPRRACARTGSGIASNCARVR